MSLLDILSHFLASEAQVWRMTEVLLAISFLVQALEFIYLSLSSKVQLKEDLGWSVAALIYEYSLGVFGSKVLNSLLGFKGFLFLQGVRAVLCLLILFGTDCGFPLSLLWIIQRLILLFQQLRFRGPFNGGSDMMSLVVLIPIMIGSVWNRPWIMKFCLVWMGVQSVLSYFIAGVIKLKEPSWRTGQALPHFLLRSYYGVPGWLKKMTDHRGVLFLLSWCVIVFECFFPVGLFFDPLMPWVLLIAIGFHLGNAVAFGLNRFLLAWIASYPAILYLSSKI